MRQWLSTINLSNLKKLELFLFYFLFFAIPLQTRTILYSPGWYYNEWQAISFYLTDLVLIALFGFWIISRFQAREFSKPTLWSAPRPLRVGVFKKLPKHDLFLIGFLIATGVSVKNSSDFFVGLFLWLKLVEFALLYFYLKTYAVRKFGFVGALYALIAGGAFQAVIAIGQFLKQGSLGLTWLGESVIGSHMTGIASFLVESSLPAEALAKAGDKIIRAYGTTPHPNILAAYLFLAIFAFYFLWLYKSSNKNHNNKNDPWYDIMIYHTGLRFWWIWYPLVLFGLFFTFSRTIIFLFFLNFFIRGFLLNFVKRFKVEFLTKSFVKQKILPIFLVTIAATVLFASLYWPEVQSRMTLSSREEAVQLRFFYNEASLKGGINLFGIGLGDFTGWLMEQNPNLPSYVYQPVHNIYLLVYSEIGIIGFVFFLLFIIGLLYEFVKKTRLRELWHYSFLLVTASVLFMGLFDHFLLTIQPGRFVFWLGLTILAVGDIIQTQSRR